jgi:acetoin:2,6-dichlorophenolindophenol oxidoreductase subunit alpha
VSDERGLHQYRLMWRIRKFEERLDRIFTQGLIDGTSHLAAGQEACAVGAAAALQRGDQVVSNHRGHGHLIALGGDIRRMMAELMGKATGYCSGRGGTQHMCVPELGFLGANGITGGGIPIATGAALAAQYSDATRVILCFFGEGASNQGTFHESLNMAAVWKLPVIYLIENNGYAMSMPIERSSGVTNLFHRAHAYGLPGVQVDGMDVDTVRDAVVVAAERARLGQGPTLLEAKTYRFFGHSKSDQRIYRTRDEEAQWRERDPILLLGLKLREAGAPAAALQAIEREEAAAVEDAVKFAMDSPFAPVETALAKAYAE